MKAPCRAILVGDSSWSRCTLHMGHPAVGMDEVALLLDGAFVDREEVLEIRVTRTCPVELFDAAIESGFYLTGMPRRARGAK